MPMSKPHLEFHPVDMNEGWHTPAGYPAGIKQKILASDLDETGKMGSRSRLLKPGSRRLHHRSFSSMTTGSRGLSDVRVISSSAMTPTQAAKVVAPTYACRPPGVHHGPFKSEQGCMLFEMHYYDESKK